MNEIFKQYGGVILSAFAFAIVLTLFYTGFHGDSFLNALGRNTELIMEDTDDGNVNTNSMTTVLNRDRPKIRIISNVREKQDIYLLDSFTITDADGYVWNRASGCFEKSGATHSGAVYVMEIRDINGNVYYDSMNHISCVYDYTTGTLKDSSPGIYNSSTGVVRYPLAGTYTVKLRILDCENVESVVYCRIAVDFVL